VFISSYRYIKHYRYADVVTGRLYMDLCYDVTSTWNRLANNAYMNIMFFNLVLVYTKCKEVLSGILFS